MTRHVARNFLRRMLGWGIAATASLIPSAATGELATQVQVVRNGVVLQTANGVGLSPDGAHLYIDGVTSTGPVIAVFARDGLSGALSLSSLAAHEVLSGLGVLEVSPDGKNLYAVRADPAPASGLYVFARQPLSGALTFVESHFAGGSRDLALSPDGAHVYVATGSNDGVSVFARNPLTGAVTFVEMQTDGVGGVDGLAYASSVVVSPDGAHVYATGIDDSAVAVFSRNALTGGLTFVEVQQNGVGGVEGMPLPSQVEVSPDGAHVYIASGPVVGDDGGIAVFSRNPGTGQLTFVEAERDGAPLTLYGQPHLLVSGDGAHLYSAFSDLIFGASRDRIVGYQRNPGTGALQMVESESNGLENNDIENFQEGVRSAAISPDGAQIYVSNLVQQGEGRVIQYDRSAFNGQLVMVRRFTGTDEADGLFAASALATSPDGADVYVAAAYEDSVAHFRCDAGTGDLSFDGVLRDGIGGITGLDGASAVAVSPDGAHVYAAATEAAAVTSFSRNPSTGALTFLEADVDGQAGVTGLQGVRALASSPGGEHLYAAGGAPSRYDSGPGFVAVFQRDSLTGSLSFVEAQADGVGGVAGIGQANAIAVSPDGDHVYVAGGSLSADADAVAVFQRNHSTGALTFVEALVDGVGGITGLDGAMALAVSPDGAQVYVASLSGAVVEFSRNPISGHLTPLAVYRDGTDGIEGLGLPRGIALSADGARVYVVSGADYSKQQGVGSLTVFNRDLSSGDLRFRNAEFEAVAGIDGMGGATAVALTADGGDVYVLAGGRNFHIVETIGDDSIVAFHNFRCPAVPQAGCRGALRSILSLTDAAGSSADQIKLKLLRADTTSIADLADPVNGPSHYALCLYDERFVGASLLHEVDAPHGDLCGSHPCWALLPLAGNRARVRYLDRRDRTPDGMASLIIRSGTAPTARLALKAKGATLPLLPTLPLTPPVTAQVINVDGACWTARFDTGDVSTNSSSQFHAIDVSP